MSKLCGSTAQASQKQYKLLTDGGGWMVFGDFHI